MNKEHSFSPTGRPSVERPWLKYYDAAHVAAPLPEQTIFELFEENNRDYPDDIAIHYLGATIRYGELAEQIDRCARSLQALGVGRNDVVTIAMPSMPEAVYMVYAVNRLGAVANMIHPLASADETCHYLNEVGSKVFVMFTGTYAIMRGHLEKTTVTTSVVVSPVQSLGRTVRWIYGLKNRKERVAESNSVMMWETFVRKGEGLTLPPPQRADRDWAVISHTGGTTGTPKGVVCTNRNIIAQIVQMIEKRNIKRQNCMFMQLPPFINYSLVSMVETFSYGFRALLVPRYDPTTLVKHIRKYGVNYIHSIPAYWEPLCHSKVRFGDLKTLEIIATGGEAMDTATEAQVNMMLKVGGSPAELMKGYGMTESTSGIAGTYPECNDSGCVGIPFMLTNCRVVDVQTGEELSYNEEGEICFSGPTIMVGYYKNPEATAEIIKTDADGTRWLHTGDVGYMNEDGLLFLTGRLKRLIMQKDENGMVSKIFPERIESVIMQMPEIEECCVVGKTDATRINLPIAYVVVSPKAAGVGEAEVCQSVIRWCQGQLPAYMIPSEVHVLSTMPRTDRGKIDYRALERKPKMKS